VSNCKARERNGIKRVLYSLAACFPPRGVFIIIWISPNFHLFLFPFGGRRFVVWNIYNNDCDAEESRIKRTWKYSRKRRQRERRWWKRKSLIVIITLSILFFGLILNGPKQRREHIKKKGNNLLSSLSLSPIPNYTFVLTTSSSLSLKDTRIIIHSMASLFACVWWFHVQCLWPFIELMFCVCAAGFISHTSLLTD